MTISCRSLSGGGLGSNAYSPAADEGAAVDRRRSTEMNGTRAGDARISLPRERREVGHNLGDALVGQFSCGDGRHLASALAHNAEDLVVATRKRHESRARIASSALAVAHLTHAVE